MRLSVLGAAGRTGARLVTAALDQGHDATAAVRDPGRIDASRHRLRVVLADVLDPTTIPAAVRGADAVLSSVGNPDGKEPTRVYSAGVSNILSAMADAGVRRLVVVSALPVTPRDQVGIVERLVAYPILNRFFGEGYADMARMEQTVRGSAADWTIVRPPRLTNGAATGRYRTAVNRHLPRATRLSRSDLAAVMLRQLDDPNAVNATVAVGY